MNLVLSSLVSEPYGFMSRAHGMKLNNVLKNGCKAGVKECEMG